MNGGAGFNLFDKDEEGGFIEGFNYYPYSLMLMKLWPGYWKNTLERIKI